MPLYLNQVGSSNKFWRYEINGKSITYKWGRVGTDGDVLTEILDNRKLQKKISEKLKKGYTLIDEGKLEKEEEVANKLGLRTKISSIDFVSMAQKSGEVKTKLLSEYDPAEWILVKLLDSWSKDETWMLIKAEKSGQCMGLNPVSGTTAARTWNTSYASSFKAEAIRDYLYDMTQKFVKIVKTAFGSYGARALDDESYRAALGKFTEESKNELGADVVTKIAKIGFTNMGGFANMGTRVLDV